MYGEQTGYANAGTAQDVPKSTSETAQSIIETIRKQAEQLEASARIFADNVAGGVPEKVAGPQPPASQPNLVDQLRRVREILGDACRHLARGREAGGF